MYKKLLFLIFTGVFSLQSSLFAQTLGPKTIASAGGTSVNGGVSLSWTVGEPATSTLQNGTVLLTQGEQQPYILLKILNLKAFLQGYYLGGGQMQAVLSNNDPFLPANYCDTITVELHDQFSPATVVASKQVVILTNGTANIQFPSTVANGSYYIVIKHRNSLETWSKNPVSFSTSTVTYDFSTP